MISKSTFYRIVPIFICLLSIVSVDQWNVFKIGNESTYWVFQFSIIVLSYLYYYSFIRKKKNEYNFNVLKPYLFWYILSSIRGIFVAENYWEYRQLINGFIALSLPLTVYVFSDINILHKTLKLWFKYLLPLFFVFFIWSLKVTAYHFYLGPVLFMSCFLPILNKKWQIIMGVLLIIMLFSDFGARSQVIKSIFVILLIILYFLRGYYANNFLKFINFSLYVFPIILLLSFVIWDYNIFSELSKTQGKFIQKRYTNGYYEEEDLSSDTRSFIYEEVITSAIRNNYIIWGRTPARGNDSFAFGSHNAEILKTRKYERHSNEVCFPNIFTWLGLIGLILYCIIYIKSSYLALYESNNIFMKMIGVYISFKFCFAWVEDFNRLDIMNVSIWMMISMGFSEEFRAMDNRRFYCWIRSIF